MTICIYVYQTFKYNYEFSESSLANAIINLLIAIESFDNVYATKLKNSIEEAILREST